MSTFLTEHYIREVEQLYTYGGSANETSIRFAFQKLLDSNCHQKGFLLIPELAFKKPGAALMQLHIGYEAVEEWPLRVTRVGLETQASVIPAQTGIHASNDVLKNPETFKKGGRTISKSTQMFNEQETLDIIPTTTPSLKTPKAKLKADKERGIIILDDQTELHGIPPEAWDYKLGNRSALEWILDQYKEKTPRDPTIREKFNTYRFSDYKPHVIGLLKRVTILSVRTTEIVREMSAETF